MSSSPQTTSDRAPIDWRRWATWQTAVAALVLASASFSIAVNQVSLGLGLALLLARGFLARQWPPATPVFWSAAALAIWALGMVPLSTDPEQSLVFYRRFFLLTAFWVTLAVATSERHRWILFGGLALGAVGVGAWGLGQGLLTEGGLFGRRFVGTVNAMTNGALLMMAFLVAVGFCVRGGGGRRRRAVLWSAVGVLGLALLITQTRSALVGAAAGVGAMILLSHPRRFPVFLAVLVLAGAVVYGSGGRVVPDSIWRRIAPEVLMHSKSGFGVRTEMWRGGWEIVKDRPLTGVGDRDLRAVCPDYYGDDKTVYHGHLHSNPVMLAAIWGVPGFVLASIYLVVPLVLMVGRWRKREWGAAAAPAEAAWLLGGVAVWAAFAVSGLTEWYFGDAEVLVMYLGILGVALGSGPGTRADAPVP